LCFLSLLALLQLPQLLQCVLQPLVLFLPRSGLRLSGFRTRFFVPRIAHLRHPLPRPLQVFSNGRFLLIASGACQRLDLRPVLHHLLQRNQPFLAEGCQHLREQLIQLLLLLPSEIRQRVIVHFLQPRQPLERRIKLAPPRHFPRRSDPLAVGAHPQANQQLWIERWPPAFFRAALDVIVKSLQVQSPDQRPNRPRPMILSDQPLHIHGPPTHLLPVDRTDQRLLARYIFLAHPPSIPSSILFSRGN